MRVWLMTVGEPLPVPLGARLMRTGLLAELLARDGHNVVWWTSTFDVSTKTHRFPHDTRIPISASYEVRLLKSVGYRRNISPRRVLEHEGVARRFRRMSAHEIAPDVILCSYPTLELCREAVRYGELVDVPVALDVRDLWPDILVDRTPTRFRAGMKLAIKPAAELARRLALSATAVIGVTDDAVEWLLDKADRKRSELDRCFPPGYPETVPTVAAAEAASSFWKQLGVNAEAQDLLVCFFGTMTASSELGTVLSAAQLLAKQRQRIRFVLCGTGPQLEGLRRSSRAHDNVLLPGWIDAAQIWTLMRLASVGLACYADDVNYRVVLPNKPVEYLSAGLPVVSSNKGVLGRLLLEHDCGVTYEGTDPVGLARTLIALKEDPEHLRRLAENAASLYRREFRAEQVYSSLSDYLTELKSAGAGVQTRRG